jgi:catechol 2,3-dioxygenase-like lactoylglutathione lyase family enzyme
MALEGALYHVGIVVPDLEAAQARLSDLLGITWGPVMDIAAMDIRDGDGNELTVPNKLCYSVDDPHIELVEEVPGTVWVCNEHSNLHHIGYFTDALAGDSARFSESACPLEICGRQGARVPDNFSYHRDPLGVRIELVDGALRDVMQQFMFQPPAGT